MATKHALQAGDATSGGSETPESDRAAPASKRRRVVEPWRQASSLTRQAHSDHVRCGAPPELLGSPDPTMPPPSALRTTRKNLFGTPRRPSLDDGELRRQSSSSSLVDDSFLSMDRFSDDEESFLDNEDASVEPTRLATNVNPFYIRDTENKPRRSGARMSTTPNYRQDQSPNPALHFGTPASVLSAAQPTPVAIRSHLFSAANTPRPESATPALPGRKRRPALAALNTNAPLSSIRRPVRFKRRGQAGSPSEPRLSPSGLCTELRRTCSLSTPPERMEESFSSPTSTEDSRDESSQGQSQWTSVRNQDDSLLGDDEDADLVSVGDHDGIGIESAADMFLSDREDGEAESPCASRLAHLPPPHRPRSMSPPHSPEPTRHITAAPPSPVAIRHRQFGSQTPQPPPPPTPEASFALRRNTFGGGGGRLARQVAHDSRPRFSRFREAFEEQGVLGSGSFGTVYKCRNRLDGCMYAVKVTKQRFKGKANREHVLKEVYALSALCNEDDNPHVVRYFSAFVEEGRLYIQTELCDMSLQDMIREQNYPGGLEVVAKDMARQVLEGLSRLHKHNLVHLDIKPANIFVKNGTFKIGDLGHACLARIKPESIESFSVNSGPERENSTAPCSAHREDLPSPPPVVQNKAQSSFAACLDELGPGESGGERVDSETLTELAKFEAELRPGPKRSFAEDIEEGDSRYMAEEILREDYANLPKGDVFSLGASLYEMCLGRELPANGDEWHEIRNEKLSEEALSRYSKPLRELVRLMLIHNPVQRPSAEALLASGGPDGILRTESEAELARERAAADEYRRELARMRASGGSTRYASADPSSMMFLRRSNTM